MSRLLSPLAAALVVFALAGCVSGERKVQPSASAAMASIPNSLVGDWDAVHNEQGSVNSILIEPNGNATIYAGDTANASFYGGEVKYDSSSRTVSCLRYTFAFDEKKQTLTPIGEKKTRHGFTLKKRPLPEFLTGHWIPTTEPKGNSIRIEIGLEGSEQCQIWEVGGADGISFSGTPSGSYNSSTHTLTFGGHTFAYDAKNQTLKTVDEKDKKLRYTYKRIRGAD